MPEIGELRALLTHDGATAHADDRDGYYWGNVAFHERFADLAKNKTLKRILESLVLRSLRLRRLTLSSPGRDGTLARRPRAPGHARSRIATANSPRR